SILLLTSDGITEATLNPVNPVTGSSSDGSTSTSSRLESSGLWQLLLQEPAPFDLSNFLARIRERTNPIQEDDQTLVSLEVL
ncbi:MAG: fused response regulator/phosphatase, partial [Moorea sp. SIO3I6]|nr:fused response regulator/phosphatase [Moorena sp. SIO3I6]